MQRAFRLRASADFKEVRATKHPWAHPLLILYTAPNNLKHPRVGVSVSRRIGKAVVRNLVRRRIREAVRLHLDASLSCDLLFIARPPSASAGWSSLREAVQALLRRAGLGPRPQELGAY